LWPDGTFVEFDKGLNTAVKKLRQALMDSADSPVFIETLPRRGYRFIAPITDNGDAEPNGTASSTNGSSAVGKKGANASGRAVNGTSESEGGASGRLTRATYISIAVLFAAVAGIALFVRHKPVGREASSVVPSMSLTTLTQNGKIREMVISADGQYVTYALREGLTQSLWIRDVRTGNDLQLLAPDTVNFPGLAFSPDGAFVYFDRSEKTNPTFGYLCRMPSAGGPVEQLIRDADSPVSFAPDGKRFVYTRGYPPRDVTQIRIADRDGANDHALLEIPGHQVYEAGATWSPNDKTIAVPMHIIGKESRFVLYAISLTNPRATELYSSEGAIGRPV
jgi:hypothetical protein